MRSVTFTVLIEDPTAIDVKVHVVAQEPPHGAAITPFKPCIVTTRRDANDDEYTLGGYAGI